MRNVRYSMPDQAFVDDDVIFTPVVSQDGLPGFEVYRPDLDRSTYIYMNPSSRDGEEILPCVFIYQGPEFNPARDATLVYIEVEGI